MARRILLATALVAPLVAGTALAAPAGADPLHAKDSLQLQVSCANGRTYLVVSNGNGNWTPAHDLSSTSTLIPLAFGEQTFTVTDPSGTVVDQETQPPSAKGASADASRSTQTTCTFSGSQTDPASGYTFSISGTVLGFVTPLG